MRNILSYQQGTKFTGKEILDWANFQVENETSHKEQGLTILNRFDGINPERLYQIKTSYKGVGCGEIVNKPIVIGCLIDCGYK